MRFADRRYYVERYIKCDCCGVLIYDAGIAANAPDGSPRLFCSDWCRDWIGNMLMMSSYHISPSTIAAYLEQLERFDPVVIHA